jgi:hypothetical protein
MIQTNVAYLWGSLEVNSIYYDLRNGEAEPSLEWSSSIKSTTRIVKSTTLMYLTLLFHIKKYTFLKGSSVHSFAVPYSTYSIRATVRYFFFEINLLRSVFSMVHYYSVSLLS